MDRAPLSTVKPTSNSRPPRHTTCWNTPASQQRKAHQKGDQEGYWEAENGKASGPDNIPAEAVKADLDTTTEILHSLFEKI